MKLLLDACWRSIAYLLMPRVIGLSLLPLLITGGLTVAAGYFFWEDAVAGVRAMLENWSLLEALLKWLDATLGLGLHTLLAPLIVVALAVPVIVVVSLLLVAYLMTPAIVSLVAERRFADLERRRGGAWWQSVLWSLGCTLVALAAMVVSIPLWFVPPLVLVVPPLIWGWLTTQVMTFDVLALHASKAERRDLVAAHRWPLLLIGVITGCLGAAPSLLWAINAATLVLAPVLVVLSVWLYTLVFAFSALWFTHYALALLKLQRTPPPVPVDPLRSADAAVPIAFPHPVWNPTPPPALPPG
jgi:hypothetical protein